MWEFIKMTLASAGANTAGVIFDAGHFLSIGPLATAFVIAFVVVFVRLRRRRGGRAPSFKRVFTALFPKRVFLHGSAKMDYLVFLIQILELFLQTQQESALGMFYQ